MACSILPLVVPCESPLHFSFARVVNHPPISLPVITVPQGVILGSVLCGSVPLSGKAWEAGSRAGVLVMGNPRWWPWEAKENREDHCCCNYTLALFFWNQWRGMLVAVSFRPSCFSWQFWFQYWRTTDCQQLLPPPHSVPSSDVFNKMQPVSENQDSHNFCPDSGTALSNCWMQIILYCASPLDILHRFYFWFLNHFSLSRIRINKRCLK